MKVVLRVFCMLIISLHAYGDIRVISLSPNTAEIVHELIQLVPESKTRLIASIHYPGAPDYYQQLERIGNFQSLNLEKILHLQPDIVVSWQGQTPVKAIALLRRFGIKVVIFHADHLTELASAFEKIADAIGLKKAGRVLSARFDHKLQRLLDKKHAGNSKRPSVFLQLSQRPIFTVGGVGILNEVLELCGGRNLFGDINRRSFEVDLSAVLRRNPDVIIGLWGCHQKKRPFCVNQYMWQRWPMLRAVKTAQVYALSEGVLSQLSPKIIVGIQAVCDILQNASERQYNQGI